MEDFGKNNKRLEEREPVINTESGEYPASIEKMSERWREIRGEGEKRGFVERNYVALGVAIGLLVISLLTVIGGFIFLVLNAR